MAGNDTYYIFMQDHFERRTLRDIAEYRRSQGQTIWSARLGTGLFGRTNCEAGNKGPKSESEVLLAAGDRGLVKLVELGFITCPVCKPEDSEGFWETVQCSVNTNYNLNSLKEFTDKTVLPYDTRRVAWEDILPMIGAAPNRLYLPKGLAKEEVDEVRARFRDLRIIPPPVGYYDLAAKENGNFREY